MRTPVFGTLTAGQERRRRGNQLRGAKQNSASPSSRHCSTGRKVV